MKREIDRTCSSVFFSNSSSYLRTVFVHHHNCQCECHRARKKASKQRRRKPEKTRREQTTPTKQTKGQKTKKILTTLEKSCKCLAKIAVLQLACISPFLLGRVSLAVFSSFSFSTVASAAAAAATYHRYDSWCWWWWWWYTAKGQICSVLLMMTPETTATACSPVECCR